MLVVLATVAGCTGGKGDVLRVGTEASFPPFETTDDDENIVGFDIDLVAAIAEDNGWEIEVVNLSFDSLVESLATDKLDIIVAAMTIREDRAERVLFSDPYFDAYQSIVVREDDTRNITMDNIVEQGLTIAVQMGTTGADEALAIYDADIDHQNVIQYKRVNEAFMEMKSGRVDLVIIDKPVADSYIAHLGGMKILGDPFTSEQYGIAVQHGETDMINKINASLQKLMDNGEYDKIFAKWFEN